MRKKLLKIAAKITNKNFFNCYYEIKKFNNLELTNKYFTKIMDIAIKNDFYKSKKTKNLSNFDILTKEKIRKHYLPMYNLKNKKKVIANTSGGSTGEPIIIYQDRNYIDWSYGTVMYYLEDIRKVNTVCKKVTLWGSEKDLFKQMNFRGQIINFLENQIFLNSFMMDYETINRYVSVINKKKPHFLKGYAGSLYEVAKVINKENLKVFSPKFIYSAAEELKDFMRKEIETAFNAPVYDFYGSREVGAISAELNSYEHLNFSFNNAVEVLDNNNEEVAPGEEGRIVITNLHNYYFPLIRYEIGDTAIKGEFNKEYSVPTFKKITGRTTDHFKAKNGKIIHGEYFTHVFYFRKWIDLFQIIQESINDINIFVVLIDGLEIDLKDKQDIENKIKLVLGLDIKINWKVVDSIPKTKQGKHRYTISKI